MGQVPTDALATELLETSTAALGALLRERSYIGWLAIAEGDRVLAGAGANVQSQLPRISHSGIAVTTAPVPLVVNVYTEPEFRGIGIARAGRYSLEPFRAAGIALKGELAVTRDELEAGLDLLRSALEIA
jgi:GNAT superfamily N-acetyltransferase